MQHIALWHPKGGVGKTAQALNIAGGLVSRGHRVLVVDLDPQKSALWISQLSGEIGFPVVGEFPKSKPDADYLITDCPPRLEDLPLAGTVAMPVRPVAHEVAALMAAYRAVGDAEQFTLRPLVNFFDQRRAEHGRAVDSVPELSAAPRINNRSIYERVINRGLTVFSDQVSKFYAAREARYELNQAIDYLIGEHA